MIHGNGLFQVVGMGAVRSGQNLNILPRQRQQIILMGRMREKAEMM